MVDHKLIKDIKLIITDVDGVLTNGKIYIDNNNNESKGYHVDDGAAVALARLANIPIAFLSGRYSESTTIRARELKIEFCFQGKLDKINSFIEIIKNYNISPKNVCYVGDSLIDLPPMDIAGFSIAVSNAHSLVRKKADHTTILSGGEGVLLEVVELILKYQNKLDAIYSKMSKENYGYNK